MAVLKAEKLLFEVEDNYQKQSYRTRCYIYGANGKQLLSIPVIHGGESKKTKDVRLDTTTPWQQNHIKAIQSAYRSSPFFEFYEDDFKAVFTGNTNFLLDFNFKCHDFVMDCLQIDRSNSKTTEFSIGKGSTHDYRFLEDAKSKRLFDLTAYTQVFSDKHGFLENLSILDLIFMEGPNALQYLTANADKI